MKEKTWDVLLWPQILFCYGNELRVLLQSSFCIYLTNVKFCLYCTTRMKSRQETHMYMFWLLGIRIFSPIFKYIYICIYDTEVRIIGGENCNTMRIRVITKLPNSKQSYKEKVKTHKYINRQNQSTTGKLWKL